MLHDEVNWDDGVSAGRNLLDIFNVAGGTHHAQCNQGRGFCILNDLAVVAHVS